MFYVKTIARAANQFVFIIDESKFVEELSGAIPVLIEQVIMCTPSIFFLCNRFVQKSCLLQKLMIVRNAKLVCFLKCSVISILHF
jgi:ribose 5-phosphate isomerase